MRIKDYSLYLITSSQYNSRLSSFEIVKQAAKSGVDIVQMREKNMSDKEKISLGKKMSRLCEKNEIIFIVNDDPLIAKKVEACGVHLGQEDVLINPVAGVRKLLGKERIIGLSTHSIEQVIDANSMDVDYIGFGPIFETKTKDYNIGLDGIKEVIKISKKPVVFIGGINIKNIEQVLCLGGRNIAVIREIVQAKDIGEKVCQLKTVINSFRSGDEIKN